MPEKLHCDICDIDFETKNEMEKHMLEVHPEMEKKKVELECGMCHATWYTDSISLPDGLTAGSMVPYTCPTCNHDEAKVRKGTW